MVRERELLTEERMQLLQERLGMAKQLQQLIVCCKRPCKIQRGTHTDLIIGTVLVTIDVIASGLYYLGYF